MKRVLFAILFGSIAHGTPATPASAEKRIADAFSSTLSQIQSRLRASVGHQSPQIDLARREAYLLDLASEPPKKLDFINEPALLTAMRDRIKEQKPDEKDTATRALTTKDLATYLQDPGAKFGDLLKSDAKLGERLANELLFTTEKVRSGETDKGKIAKARVTRLLGAAKNGGAEGAPLELSDALIAALDLKKVEGKGFTVGDVNKALAKEGALDKLSLAQKTELMNGLETTFNGSRNPTLRENFERDVFKSVGANLASQGVASARPLDQAFDDFNRRRREADELARKEDPKRNPDGLVPLGGNGGIPVPPGQHQGGGNAGGGAGGGGTGGGPGQSFVEGQGSTQPGTIFAPGGLGGPTNGGGRLPDFVPSASMDRVRQIADRFRPGGACASKWPSKPITLTLTSSDGTTKVTETGDCTATMIKKAGETPRQSTALPGFCSQRLALAGHCGEGQGILTGLAFGPFSEIVAADLSFQNQAPGQPRNADGLVATVMVRCSELEAARDLIVEVASPSDLIVDTKGSFNQPILASANQSLPGRDSRTGGVLAAVTYDASKDGFGGFYLGNPNSESANAKALAQYNFGQPNIEGNSGGGLFTVVNEEDTSSCELKLIGVNHAKLASPATEIGVGRFNQYAGGPKTMAFFQSELTRDPKTLALRRLPGSSRTVAAGDRPHTDKLTSVTRPVATP